MLTQNGLMDKEKQKFLTEVLRQPYTSSIPKKWKDNKEIVLATMKFNGHLLQEASLRLKDDKEVVLAAIRDKAYTLNYASARLRDDKEVVLAAVKTHTWSLNKASSRLKDDKEVVLTSVRGNGMSLKFASARLKDDKEVVEAALASNFHSIEYMMNVEALHKLNPSLFSQEDRTRIYNTFIQGTQEKDLFLHAKMKRYFLS